jgi:hypothetical protein
MADSFLALGHARLKDHVSGMPGQLEGVINEGGSYSLPLNTLPWDVSLPPPDMDSGRWDA